MSVIHWFRRDLRVQDNTALYAALTSGQPVVPLFVLDDRLLRSPRAGALRVAFLLRALHSLDKSLQRYGTRLLVQQGDPRVIVPALVEDIGARAVYMNVDYSPYARTRDAAVEAALTIPLHAFDDAVLVPPDSLFNKQGKPYTVFTPYRKSWEAVPKADKSSLTIVPEMFVPAEGSGPEIPTLADLGFSGTGSVPEASEDMAHTLLNAFVQQDLAQYATTRNALVINPFVEPRPAGSSYLSPHLRLGLLSPRQAYHTALDTLSTAESNGERESITTWISELAWRDFYVQVMYHAPHVLTRDFKPQYAHLAWEYDPEKLAAWQEGRTGYPIIDAPMRQLNTIGWMPNRARMIVASFLTRDLLIHWRAGELYFMQHLIDGDPAANNGGWQWAAGTGTDAQPFHRIFNPVMQSEKFATATYLRYWLPELKDVPDRFIHAPWTMPEPPRDYPGPIVDHHWARSRALEVFRQSRASSQPMETNTDD
jgi:deoxyribodipyrimidine photo-lyase